MPVYTVNIFIFQFDILYIIHYTLLSSSAITYLHIYVRYKGQLQFTFMLL